MSIKTLWVLLIVLIIVLACLIALSIVDENQRRATAVMLYNNGTCAECGGHWHIVSQDRLYRYTYECDKCYKTFESNTRLK